MTRAYKLVQCFNPVKLSSLWVWQLHYLTQGSCSVRCFDWQRHNMFRISTAISLMWDANIPSMISTSILASFGIPPNTKRGQILYIALAMITTAIAYVKFLWESEFTWKYDNLSVFSSMEGEMLILSYTWQVSRGWSTLAGNKSKINTTRSVESELRMLRGTGSESGILINLLLLADSEWAVVVS